MFLHCLRCNVGLGHEAETLPHDAYMTDEGPLCGECADRLLNAALPMLGVCNRIVKWLDGLAADAERKAPTERFLTLRDAYIADAKNYRATAADVRRAIARAEGIEQNAEPGAEEQPYDAGGESPSYRAHMIDAGRGGLLS